MIDMTDLYLQKIANRFDLNKIPLDWQAIDFDRFSNSKYLFDYQKEALQNSLKVLYLYLNEFNSDKSQFFEHYKNNGLEEDLDYTVKKEGKLLKYLSDYQNDYPIVDEKISFKYFINRMSFWMATGSGKTLVIVKLIELLSKLIQNNKIPKNDILFLTYREDLIDQFKKHVDEFNKSNSNIKINLISLKEYDDNKRQSRISFENTVNVYFYKSDLISDEEKDKIVNYRNYDNGGKWYILLDEGHKGDKEDSKLQILCSIMTRNGFLFSFSATFTDPRDYATCAYNFNLEQFIKQGYGKHIYISKESLKAFEEKKKSIDQEKQKILLKTFILQVAINKNLEVIRQKENMYHKPLLLTLAFSVNTEDSDLELFFKALEQLATGEINKKLLDDAKQELINELTKEDSEFYFEGKKIDEKIIKYIEDSNFNDILKYVFNSEKAGKIEVLKMPSNKQELVFKLVTSDRPFALMKIGDITEWLKNKLYNYVITEKYEDESIFKNINQSEDINILMGSHSFYEGWDSNRPNIILFINIGKGVKAKKFVLQSVGRGVRIEPLLHKRKRAVFLYDNKEINKDVFESINEYVEPIESLFVFGTKAENLKEIIETLKQEKREENLGDLFEINPDIKNKLLLIPTYRNSDKAIIEENEIIKYEINPSDFQIVSSCLNNLDDRILICKFDCSLNVLSRVKEGLNKRKEHYIIEEEKKTQIRNPDVLLDNIFKHFSSRTKEFNSFKQLEDEIIHFKRISISADKLDDLKEKIERIKQYKEPTEIEKKLDQKLTKKEITLEEYKRKLKEINNIKNEEEIKYSENEKLRIKYLAKHYYIPILLSDSEKVDYISHIIKNESEIEFIKKLEDYLKNEDNIFKKFDWWFFSKIDENLDDVYIPYYNPKTNRIDKFKPDFIFWISKGNEYLIIFVDPKGTEHTDAYRKIDGYSRIFESVYDEKKVSKEFKYNNLHIKTKLLLKPAVGIAEVPEEYRPYWFDNFDDLKRTISENTREKRSL